jgi:hypothetical protein
MLFFCAFRFCESLWSPFGCLTVLLIWVATLNFISFWVCLVIYMPYPIPRLRTHSIWVYNIPRTYTGCLCTTSMYVILNICFQNFSFLLGNLWFLRSSLVPENIVNCCWTIFKSHIVYEILNKSSCIFFFVFFCLFLSFIKVEGVILSFRFSFGFWWIPSFW